MEMATIKCPKCGAKISDTCRKCNNCGFDGISSYLLQIEREKNAKIIGYTKDPSPIVKNYETPTNNSYKPKPVIEENIPRCPTCHSTKIKKIGAFERMASVGFWGPFSKKINKTFKCENCGYTW